MSFRCERADLGSIARRELVTLAPVNNSRRVYSTGEGRIRPRAADRPPTSAGPRVPNDGVVRIFRDRGGRNGKVVTVIRGLPAPELEERASDLKRLCGAGGAVKDGAVEIQGDHREKIADRLRTLGHSVKLAGG
jgi:translation initiation factor 1